MRAIRETGKEAVPISGLMRLIWHQWHERQRACGTDSGLCTG